MEIHFLFLLRKLIFCVFYVKPVDNCTFIVTGWQLPSKLVELGKRLKMQVTKAVVVVASMDENET